MENPFTLKVGQVFTGFGIGCGIGIGVGRPLNLGAIPMLQQVMIATRGATDAFSGAGRHVNSSLRRLGVTNVEAGIGCGVGVGHGFGIGLALKPGVLHQIQSSVMQAMAKMMTKLGISPVLADSQSPIARSLQSSIPVISGNSAGNVQNTGGNFLQLASKASESTLHGQTGDESSHIHPKNESFASKGTTDVALGSHSEKVVSNFLQDPILKNEEIELGDMAGQLRLENNVLQVLLKHQQIIQELLEENERLHQVLVEDLKVSPSKLQTSIKNRTKFNTPCSDCFECRRRHRKSAR